jgi:hypothetical protein
MEFKGDMRNMKKINLIIILTLLSVICLASISFSANIPQTGQTQCYTTAGAVTLCPGTGQDGQFQAGDIAQPSPRFTDHGDGTITDNLTGRMWAKDIKCQLTKYPAYDADGAVNWQNSLTFANGVNSGLYLNCQNGYTDWEVPNVKDCEYLMSQIPLGYANPLAWLTANGFTGAGVTSVWTNTTSNQAGVYTGAFICPLSSLNSVYSAAKTGTYYTWLVRGNSTIIPQSGQTTCYNAAGANIACAGTGQDGDIQAGAVMPVPRYVDNGDMTVTDMFTGRVWMQKQNWFFAGTGICGPGGGTTYNYANAVNAVNYLSLNLCGGRPDWRIPTANEVASVTDYSLATPSFYLPGAPFTNAGATTLNSAYWTSSENLYSAGAVLNNTVKTPVGSFTNSVARTGTAKVWAVAGGVTVTGQLSVSPASLAFSTVYIGFPVTLPLTVSNTGTGDVTIVTTVSGTGYSITAGTCPAVTNFVLSAGGSCNLNLTLTTASTGAKNGTLTVSSSNSFPYTYSVAMTGTGALALSFSVSKSGTGTGTITTSPGSINCGGVCSDTFPATTLTVTAIADAPATFTRWTTGACTNSTSNICVFNISSSTSMDAQMDLPVSNYTLTTTVSGPGTGTVINNPVGPIYSSGTLVTLTATPTGTAFFAIWTTGPCAGSDNPVCNFNITEDVSADAQFDFPPEIEILPEMPVNPPQGYWATGYDFSDVVFGLSKTKTFIIKNIGYGVVTLQNPHFECIGFQNPLGGCDVNSASMQITSNTCDTPLSHDETCTVTVTFTPLVGAGVGQYNTLILHGVSFSGQGSPIIRYNIGGYGIDACFSYTPDSHDFGDVALGATAGPLTIRIQNICGYDVTIDEDTLTGLDSDDFEIMNDTCSGATLAGGQVCTYDIGVKP